MRASARPHLLRLSSQGQGRHPPSTYSHLLRLSSQHSPPMHSSASCWTLPSPGRGYRYPVRVRGYSATWCWETPWTGRSFRRHHTPAQRGMGWIRMALQPTKPHPYEYPTRDGDSRRVRAGHKEHGGRNWMAAQPT